MTSRTHRGIGIIFISLLAIAFLLELQAAPTSSARRTKKNRDNESTGVSEKFKYIQNYLTELADRAKCPFIVKVNVNGFTEVVCDPTNCTRDNSCDDCRQGYLYAKDILPKTGCKKKMRTSTKIPAGCFYIPKNKNQSIESPGPEK
jgi:hypothetical protein